MNVLKKNNELMTEETLLFIWHFISVPWEWKYSSVFPKQGLPYNTLNIKGQKESPESAQEWKSFKNCTYG